MKEEMGGGVGWGREYGAGTEPGSEVRSGRGRFSSLSLSSSCPLQTHPFPLPMVHERHFTFVAKFC